MSNFLRHEPCPRCKSKDNLGRYTDGGAYCFGCGYVEHPDGKQASMQRGFVPKYFDEELHVLDEGTEAYMFYKYGLNSDTCNLYVRQHRDDLMLKVQSPYGVHRGWMMKRLDTDRNKGKSLSFKEKDDVWLAWFMHTGGNPRHVVIVEDQLSAMRVWQLGFVSVALLGASMGPTKWGEITKFCWKSPLMALDRDKFEQAMHYRQKYGVRPVLLHEDIKDVEDDDDIRRTLGVHPIAIEPPQRP